MIDGDCHDAGIADTQMPMKVAVDNDESAAHCQGSLAPSHRLHVSAARKACSRRLRDMMKLLAKFQKPAVSFLSLIAL